MDPGNTGGSGTEIGTCTRLSSSAMGAAGEKVNTDDIKAFEYIFTKDGVDTTTRGLALRIFGIPRLTQAATGGQYAKNAFIRTGEIADGMDLGSKSKYVLQDDDGSADSKNCKGRTNTHIKDALSLIKEATDYASKFDYSGYTDFTQSGSVIEDAIKWATQIANDENHGYSQVTRNGNPNYDCSSLVINAFENAGLGVIENGASYTGNMIKAFENVGFTYIAYPNGAPDTTQLKRGDVLMRIGASGKNDHTELYIGNSKTIGAHKDYDLKNGDGSGKEINIGSYSKSSKWTGVLRYTGGSSTPTRDVTFTLRSREGTISVFDAHSNISIPANNLMFSCNLDKCSDMIVGNWDGNSGVIVAFAKSINDCDITLNAYYVKNETTCKNLSVIPPDPTCQYDSLCNGESPTANPDDSSNQPDDNSGDSPVALKYNPDDPLCYVYFCTTPSSTQNYLICLTPEQNEKITGVKSCKSGKSSTGSCNNNSTSIADTTNLADFNMNIGSGIFTSASFKFSYPSNANMTCVNNETPPAQIIGGSVAEACTHDCCPERPIELKDYPKYQINNCCGGGQSWIEEPLLNDLFCFDKKLQVDFYQDKCNISTYLVDKADFSTLNKYCDLYCTERVTYDLPNPTDNSTSGCAKSGRYFQFDRNNAWGTSGPRLEGFKRCRLKVKFDEWWNDYDPIIKEEINGYNIHEANIAAYQEFLTSTKDTESVTYKIDCYSSGTDEPSYKTGETDDTDNCLKREITYPYTCTKYAQKDVTSECSAPSDSSDKGDTTRTYDIKRYTLPFTWSYNVLKLDENNPSYKTFELDQIILDKYLKAHETYNLEKVYFEKTDTDAKEKLANEVATAQANTLNNNSDYTKHNCSSSYASATGTRSYACKVDVTYAHTRINYDETLAKYLGDANNGQSYMKTYAAQAKAMETYLSNCANFFISGPGSVVDNVYKMDPSVSFTYTQDYIDNQGKATIEQTPRTYVRSTVLKQVETGLRYGGASSHGTDDNRYAKLINDKENKGEKFVSIDFKDADLNNEPDRYNDFKSHLDEEFPKGTLAEDAHNKAFTRDAVYHLEFVWDDTNNTKYTLVPTGAVQSSTTVYNKTAHSYSISYMTSYSGNFETYFNLSGVGSEGKFDNFVNNGTTCSGKTGNATCYFCNENTIVKHGYCEKDWANIIPDDVECDPTDQKLAFTFKIVDPSNLFPEGRIYKEMKFATNWSDDDINKVENVGKQYMTYSPEHLTYSFKFTANDLKNIKEYNSARIGYGGFDDFNLYCDCGGNVCTKCMSTFIDAISGKNSLAYQGNVVGYLSINAWNNPNKSLDQIRNEQSW